MADLPEEPELVVIPAGNAIIGDPPRTEHVNVFAIARYPVTRREYAAFVDETGHATPASWRDGGTSDERAAHPVEGVSWADAVAYCGWMTRRTGRIYRLPDEREWEKAARGTSGRAWPWGEEPAGPVANTLEAGIGGTAPVGAFPAGATPEGLYDLVGNVREWTNTYADGRVCRGGSYLDPLEASRPSARQYAAGDLAGVGFRLVRGMTGR